MTVVDLDGLRVTLGEPIQVSEGVGHHWFPQIARFSTGELLCAISAVPDARGLLTHAQRVYTSTDQGQTWESRYTVSEALASVKIPRPNGDLLVVPSRVTPDAAGQWRSFSGPYVRYRDGGRQIVIESDGMRVEGLPRDIASLAEGDVAPGGVNTGTHAFDGNALDIDGRLLTTMYLRFQGDDIYTTVLFASEDEGRTWRYLSTVAGPEVPNVQHGPCEPSLAQLETGELMCVMRVGSGPEWNLARAYSKDGGESWSPADRLPAFSVEPSLMRLSNGTLTMSTGRPGIYLWLSSDPRGHSWQSIDLVARHNEWALSPEYVIVPEPSGDNDRRHANDQTTAYTELVEIEPNRLLIVYDRTARAWSPVPVDSDERSRIFVMPISVERVQSPQSIADITDRQRAFVTARNPGRNAAGEKP